MLPATLELFRDWEQTAIEVSENAFKPLPSKFWLYAKNLVRGLTAEAYEDWNLPALHGTNNPRWMRDRRGHIVVVKDGTFRGFPLAARERIASVLADSAAVPVLPSQIWQRRRPDGVVVYDSVSPKIFPDARVGPPDTMLLADDSLACAAIFNQWIFNTEQHKGNILFSALGPEEGVKVYCDYGVSNHGASNAVLPLNASRMTEDKDVVYAFSASVAAHVREQIMASPRVQAVMRNIQNIPDRDIDAPFEVLPDYLFRAPDTKQHMSQRLKRRRDTIETLVNRSVGLG
mgnify:FL=1